MSVGVTLWHHEFLGILNLPPQKGARKAKTVVPDFGASYSFPDHFFVTGDSKYQEIHDVTK